MAARRVSGLLERARECVRESSQRRAGGGERDSNGGNSKSASAVRCSLLVHLDKSNHDYVRTHTHALALLLLVLLGVAMVEGGLLHHTRGLPLFGAQQHGTNHAVDAPFNALEPLHSSGTLKHMDCAVFACERSTVFREERSSSCGLGCAPHR